MIIITNEHIRGSENYFIVVINEHYSVSDYYNQLTVNLRMSQNLRPMRPQILAYVHLV